MCALDPGGAERGGMFRHGWGFGGTKGGVLAKPGGNKENLSLFTLGDIGYDPHVLSGQAMTGDPVGVVGWGRFGCALGGLVQRTGARVSAYEPHGVLEGAVRAESLEHLATEARWILLAVPISQLQTALQGLRPFLREHHIVLDVGSVKLRPEAVLREGLGSEIPWVATHPLFGPVSLARGERPLRVVVCPNPLHAQAVEETTRWYERLGCMVTLQSADEHDRRMAWSHALAFFVAKGLLDMGADVEAELIPPSFRALESTIKAVRADAGHLFQTIQHQNPFAADARTRLLVALGEIHAELAAIDADPGADDVIPRVTIPDLGEQDPLKKPGAAQLDEVDRELVALIARRADLRSRFGAVGTPIDDREWIESSGLDRGWVDRVFALLDG